MEQNMATVLTYLFDLFILWIYLDNVLNKRKEGIPLWFYYAAYLCMESALFINESLTASMPGQIGLIITTCVSTVTTFLLTWMYQARLSERLFAALSFQILALFGEYIFTGFMQLIRPRLFDHITPALYTPMNLGSKVILFLLVLIASVLFGLLFTRPATDQLTRLSLLCRSMVMV